MLTIPGATLQRGSIQTLLLTPSNSLPVLAEDLRLEKDKPKLTYKRNQLAEKKLRTLPSSGFIQQMEKAPEKPSRYKYGRGRGKHCVNVL